MRFADYRELLADLREFYIVFPALGEEEIDLVVIFLYGGDEGCLGVAVPAFFVPRKSFGAIGGKHLVAAHRKSSAV